MSFACEKIVQTKAINPICLAAENSDYNHEKVVGVGWGLLYKESPVRTNNQDPIYSSCMSNEVGPDKWAFEPCDMNWLKKEIRVQGGWRPEICREYCHMY